MADPRILYKDDVDFATLALQSPAFNKFLKPNGQLDFSDPQAVQQLTKSLLKRDFGLDLELPDDRLCPPVPNRLNYILWIQDLLDTTSDTYTDCYDPDRKVTGLDMCVLHKSQNHPKNPQNVNSCFQRYGIKLHLSPTGLRLSIQVEIRSHW